MSNHECVFCAIIDDPSGSHVVWEGRRIIAILDISPITDGHLLVIPRQHFRALTDLDAETAGQLMHTAQVLARSLMRSSLKAEGVNLLLAENEVAGQEIFHTHLHVIPRYRGDGLVIQADWQSPSPSELGQTAERLRGLIAPGETRPREI